MTITIAATLVKPPVLEAPSGRAAGISSADDPSTGLDFASVLLGLPDKMAPADDKKAPVEVSPPLADPQFLAVLDLNPPAQARMAHERLVDPTGLPSVSTLSPGRPDTLEQQLWNQDTGARGSSALPAMSADGNGNAAKFAAAAPVAADVLTRAEPITAETSLSAASNLATLASGPHTPATGAFAQSAQEMPLGIQTPLRDASWAGELGQKLLWFVGNDKQLAQLTLNPPQLGSIEVTLQIDKDSAKAHFVSANADVRAAIETALPRLREMFAGTGIMLAQVSVGSESFQQPSGGQQGPSHQHRPMADGAILGIDASGGPTGQVIATHRGNALIDIFA